MTSISWESCVDILVVTIRSEVRKTFYWGPTVDTNVLTLILSMNIWTGDEILMVVCFLYLNENGLLIVERWKIHQQRFLYAQVSKRVMIYK